MSDRHLFAPLLARVRSASIDRRLAAGIEPWRTPVYAARCRQLTSVRSRHALAGCLERLIEQAEEPPPGWLTAAVLPPREGVHEARPELLLLSARLRNEAPVNPRGVAAIRKLLTEGDGVLYVPGDPEALKRQLRRIRVWIDD